MTQPEQRQVLVDTFINAIYLYDDKVLITFNYKEGTETVAFGEAVKAEKSSDMSARGAPDIERQIVRFDVLFYVEKRLHTVCTFARIRGFSTSFRRRFPALLLRVIAGYPMQTVFRFSRYGAGFGNKKIATQRAEPDHPFRDSLGSGSLCSDKKVKNLLRFAAQTRTFENGADFGSLLEKTRKTLAKRESQMTRFTYLFFTNSAWYGSSSTSASQTEVPSGV